MRPSLSHLTKATLVALVVGSTTFVAPAAHALPVFTSATLETQSDTEENSATACTEVANVPPDTTAPVVENGAATTATTSGNGTYTNDGDATDVISVATTASVTGKLTSVGGNPRTIDLSVTGSVSATASKPVSGCNVYAYSGGNVEVEFSVAQAGFLTVTSEGRGKAYGAFSVSSVPGADTFAFAIGQGSRFDGVQRVYLPAGNYSGDFSAYSLFDTNVAVASTPARVDIKATFDVAGSQTVAPVGKASRYVALPGSRSCATDSLDATITPKSKRAAKIKKVTFYVNDKRAKKVSKPAKGTVVKVPVVDDVAAEVRAVVVEVKKPNGKPGKESEVTASYAPCS